MTEEYSISGYLGGEYQLKVLWQLLTEPEFATQTFPFLSVNNFDDPNYKRLFILIKEYNNEYGKIPNLQNKSIYHAITKYKNPNNSTDEEILLSIIERIKNWNDRVLNKELDYDGDIVQKALFTFIKQGEYSDLANFIISKVKKGQVSDTILSSIEEKIKKISEIGLEEDDGVDVAEDIDSILDDEFRNPIGTGILQIDQLMGGGLANGEIGIILAATGTGKSTALTKIANEGHSLGKNVLQIIFEDTKAEIKKKHYAIWSGIPLSEMKEKKVEVRDKVKNYLKENKESIGKIILKRFSQEDTTIPIIRSWIDRYKKKWGIKFDLIVLDYLDCIEPHKKATDQNQAELSIIKAFESMAAEYDIPCWSALQTNRSGIGAEFVETGQMGGNIKRAQKTHFLMSVAKTTDQKDAGLANIQILKARFAKDGQRFEDVVFDNDKIKIEMYDDTRRSKSVNLPSVDEEKIDNLNAKLVNINSSTSLVNEDNEIKNKDEFIEEPTNINIDNQIKILNDNVEVPDETKDLIMEKLNQMSENQDFMKKE